MRRITSAMIWVALFGGVYLAISLETNPPSKRQRAGLSAPREGHPAGCPACHKSGPPLPEEIGETNLRFVGVKHDHPL